MSLLDKWELLRLTKARVHLRRTPASRGLSDRAYHGSPYKFSQFSTQKLGSGANSASYGWGLYFTQSLRLAQSYREEKETRGCLYEVELPDAGELLDWNRPMRAKYAETERQPSGVLYKLSKIIPGIDQPDADAVIRTPFERSRKLKDLTGEDLYKDLAEALWGRVENASKKLQELSIHGLRYSIGSKSNYVIWDESRIKVVKKTC